jgi:hypothetical protein
MIFQKEHIEQIRKGIKTQTRRVNRGVYQIGKDYAVQPCRTCKGIKGMRIVIDEIYESRYNTFHISKEDAKAEGNYTPEEFEKKFRELNPKWDGVSRWVFAFHLGERIGE